MVFGADSMPTRIPDLGHSKERNLNSVKNKSVVIEHVCRTALGPGPSPATRLCSVLCPSALWWVGLLCLPILCHALQHVWFQHSQQDTVYTFWWKRKVHSSDPQGAGLYRQRSSPLVPDWSILMQMRTFNPHSLIGLRALFWLVRIELLWLEISSLTGWGKPIGWNRIPGNFYKVLLIWLKYSAGWQFSAETSSSTQRQAV